MIGPSPALPPSANAHVGGCEHAGDTISAMSAATTQSVWCFLGESLPGRRTSHPSAIFSSLEAAERWISAHALSGLLTQHHLDVPAFDRSLSLGTVPLSQRDGSLRQNWAGGEIHHHYENGRKVG